MSALSDRIARLVADAIAGDDVYCELEDVTREVDEMCARTVSAPVDVMAVLREFATRKNPFGSTEQAVRKYEAARAAVAELIEFKAVAQKALTAVAGLIEDSHGVAGLHLNGDIAEWHELRTGGRFEEWLLDFDAALARVQGKAVQS